MGSGLIPLGLALRSPAPAKRVLFGNLAFGGVGALVGLVAVTYGAEQVAWLGADPARQIANAHTGFNVLLALAFLPLLGPIATALERILRKSRIRPTSASTTSTSRCSTAPPWRLPTRRAK